MTRLSGITPSGHIHLGNHLGAIRRWAAESEPDDLYFVSDLHAMTLPYRPERLRALTRENLAVLLAAGIDPGSVFVQSDLVGELGALNWVLECTCGYGEAARMIQFKEKAAEQDSARLGLLTYPVLMAADILLQGASEVPVGNDQNQHVELARTLARRFNASYGEVFTVPAAAVPRAAAGVRDLADPGRKMAKSAQQQNGVVFVLDEPDVVQRKINRAKTDDLRDVRYEPEQRPGLANLIEILAVCTGVSPYAAARTATTYAQLKDAVAEAVLEELRPVRERARELLDDPGELERVREKGARQAAERASSRLDAALRVAGLR
ncbi:tryptophan--tRNA ligase [Saccharopolyspora sp. SCSIO 74807]|uniref:tryptophan--tRNA ligase n=1 Tax=Saccharopolyspora sp. SCSIO 74807 TaxID=3118084 RepID=UPI0030D2A2CE